MHASGKRMEDEKRSEYQTDEYSSYTLFSERDFKPGLKFKLQDRFFGKRNYEKRIFIGYNSNDTVKFEEICKQVVKYRERTTDPWVLRG